MATRALPSWTRKMPGQYGSNGINSDGSLMNVNNKLGDRPSIRLFPQYNSGDTMRALLADCGGLGEGLSAPPPQRPAAIDYNRRAPQNTRTTPPRQMQTQYLYSPQQHLQFTPTKSPVSGSPRTPRKKSPDHMSQTEAQRVLWDAARQGDTNLVRNALENGADPMKPNPTDGWLALHYAAASNKRLTCQLLLSLPSASQQCSVRSVSGETPLQLCRSPFVKNLVRENSKL